MINSTNAAAYFKSGNHIRGAVWSGFDPQQQAAAIVGSRRVLSRALGRALDDNEAAYAEGDQVREEYAVYEQALWMLENGVIANGEQSGPGFIASDPEKPQNVRDTQKALLAPEALRWLGANQKVVILIGG